MATTMTETTFGGLPKGSLFINAGNTFIKTTKTTCFLLSEHGSAKCKTYRNVLSGTPVTLVASARDLHLVAKDMVQPAEAAF